MSSVNLFDILPTNLELDIHKISFHLVYMVYCNWSTENWAVIHRNHNEKNKHYFVSGFNVFKCEGFET